MSLLRSVLEAFRQGLRRGLGNRLTQVIAVIGVLIGLIAAISAGSGEFAGEVTGIDFFGAGGYLLGLQGCLPLLGCYLGAELVHGEISDRSSTHVFVRPVPRAAVLIGRWLAASLTVAVVMGIVFSVAWLAFRVTAPEWRLGLAAGPDILGGLVLGAAAAGPAYAAVGALAGATFKRPVVWSLAFVVGWEFVVSNLPPEAGVRIWTIADPLRRLVYEVLQPDAGSGLSSVLRGSARDYDPSLFPAPVPSLVRFTAIALGLALFVYTRREYDSRARD